MTSGFLVDTQVLLWWLNDDRALSDTARALIADEGNRLQVSAASVWEIAMKRALGKLRAPDDLLEVLEEEDFELLAVSADHAWAVRSLPSVQGHRDPFDRLMVAQARHDRLDLISSDRRFDAYDVTRHW